MTSQTKVSKTDSSKEIKYRLCRVKNLPTNIPRTNPLDLSMIYLFCEFPIFFEIFFETGPQTGPHLNI